MGTLRSLKNWSWQIVVNGVMLGDPVELDNDPHTFEWDDARIPNGEIDDDGNVIPDEPPMPEPTPEPTPEPEPEPEPDAE
jgi:hypothetical protein